VCGSRVGGAGCVAAGAVPAGISGGGVDWDDWGGVDWDGVGGARKIMLHKTATRKKPSKATPSDQMNFQLSAG